MKPMGSIVFAATSTTSIARSPEAGVIPQSTKALTSKSCSPRAGIDPPLLPLQMTPPPPLTVVAALAREYPVLEPIALSISAFLERPTELSLAQTCAYGSLTLLDRMWAASPSTTAAADRASSSGEAWSLRWFLRSNRDYKHCQFEKAMTQATVRGDLRMVQWLFGHFSGCVVRRDAVDKAIGGGHLEILQFWWAAGRPILPPKTEGSSETPEEIRAAQDTSRRNSVDWRDFATVKYPCSDWRKAVEAHHADVIWWLIRTVRRDTNWDAEVMACAARYGDIPQVQWMLENGPPEKAETRVSAGRLEALQWLVNQGFRTDTGLLLHHAARSGHLELVQWLIQRYPRVQARPALSAACEQGHSEVARFLVNHSSSSRGACAVTAAVRGGDLELLEYLRSHGLRNGCRFLALVHASRNGRLDLVQWVLEHFNDGTWEDESPTSSIGLTGYPMDVAAANGHLEVLQFLHSIDPRPILDWTRSRRSSQNLHLNLMCTTQAMDDAALNGHLEVVKWLHENRSEGCNLAFRKALASGHTHVAGWMLEHRKQDCCFRSESAEYLSWGRETIFGVESRDPLLDEAAKYGRLDVIQWLNSRGQLKGSEIAMAYAAGGGHLDVMKWLHENRSEACTTDAMDYAARCGQLAAVRWLQEYRTEGCTTKAMTDAAKYNHFDVVLFLHSHRTEGCDADLDYYSTEYPHVLRWVRRNYPQP